MAANNNTTFIGRVATELRVAPSGNVADFQLAVETRRKDDNGKRQAIFLTLKIFNGSIQAFEQYVSKGDLIAFQGEADVETWTSKSGDPRSRVVFIGNVHFLPNPKRGGQEPPADLNIPAEATPAEAPAAQAELPVGVGGDDIPF